MKEGDIVYYEGLKAKIITIFDDNRVEILVNSRGRQKIYKYVLVEEIMNPGELESTKLDVKSCLDRCNQKIELLKELITLVDNENMTLGEALELKCKEAERYLKRLEELENEI